MVQLTPPPTAPQTSDRSTFAARADALVAWFATFVSEMTLLVAAIYTLVTGSPFALTYSFSTTTADADPGDGYIRLSNATQNLSTVLRVDEKAADGTSQAGALDLYDDSTSSTKGFLKIIKADDTSKWLLFAVTAMASPSGYRNFTVTPVTGSAASPFADGDRVILEFTRNGDKGDQGTAGVPIVNLLDNPAFQIAQEFTASTAVADDVYALDQWYVLTQTASVNVSQLTDPEDGYTHGMRLSQNQASAQRMGFAQIIEGKRCKHLRGGSATLVPRIRISSAQAVRYAILGWTGTEDVVTSDVVNDWTNATFTAGQFFKSTTQSVLAVGAVTPSANVWTSLAALTAAVGSSFNNLIVMVWTEGTAAQNVTLDVDYVQLESGVVANSFQRRDPVAELLRCRFFYQQWGGGSTTQRIGVGPVVTAQIVQCVVIPGIMDMRMDPAISFNNLQVYDGSVAPAVTAVDLVTAGNGKDIAFQVTCGAGGLTVHRNGQLCADGTTAARLKISARL